MGLRLLGSLQFRGAKIDKTPTPAGFSLPCITWHIVELPFVEGKKSSSAFMQLTPRMETRQSRPHLQMQPDRSTNGDL